MTKGSFVFSVGGQRLVAIRPTVAKEGATYRELVASAKGGTPLKAEEAGELETAFIMLRNTSATNTWLKLKRYRLILDPLVPIYEHVHYRSLLWYWWYELDQDPDSVWPAEPSQWVSGLINAETEAGERVLIIRKHLARSRRRRS